MGIEPDVAVDDVPYTDEDAEEDLREQELIDEILASGWAPEDDPCGDYDLFGDASLARPAGMLSVMPSEFTEFAFRMPNTNIQKETDPTHVPFSFNGRRHMRRIYDTPAKRIHLMCGRQVEKSTALGNLAVAYSCMVPGYRTLYVSPSATQTKTFSVDRLKEPLETSDVLKGFTTTLLQQNVFEKQFVNRSKITLRYAFLNADRIRGISAWRLCIDEIQDILSDNIPVIEQAVSHADDKWKSFIYAGTPKGLDNSIEYYRSGTSKDGTPMSTMGEWAVPCDRHGGETGRYWNILGEANIQKKGLSCEKCHKPIDPAHSDAQWTMLQSKGIFESYRIPQLMVPWRSWQEIMLDYTRYDRARFHNEVLGISYDSGLRPLTRQQLKECCTGGSMLSHSLEKYKTLSAGQPVFAGIDWGCHDEETRILTEDGFKYFRDLVDDDRVAQWDPETRAMTFVRPLARTVRDWDKPLRHFKTRGGLDLMVTTTHRMRVTVAGREQWVTESAGVTAERGGCVSFVGHVSWVGEEVKRFTLPGLPASPGYGGSDARTVPMDDWLELLGYLITEGGVCFDDGRMSCVKMSQRETINHETYLKMQRCLDKLAVPHSRFPNPKTGDVNWTIYGKQYWSWYAENIGVEGDEKRIPRKFLSLSPRQLRILFHALVDGDGYTDPREGCTGGAFYSTSKGLCDDFQEICIRLGLRCVVRLHKPAEGNHKTRWRALWSEGRDYQLNVPHNAVKHVPYKGKVYCCAVPTGYIVTERNGCIAYQGNTGENTYTVLVLGTYIGNRFRIFYAHRFTGEDVNPEPQLTKISQMLQYFNVLLVGADYGGGFHPNDHLTRLFGPKRIWKYQYLPRGKKKLYFHPGFRRYMAVRTEVMSDLFNAVKRKQIEFPNWDEFEDPHGNDFLNIFAKYNSTLRMLQYDHRPDRPDDTMHAVLYCFLASMLKFPRPDIIAPNRELPGVGPLRSTWSGPTNQG